MVDEPTLDEDNFDELMDALPTKVRNKVLRHLRGLSSSNESPAPDPDAMDDLDFAARWKRAEEAAQVPDVPVPKIVAYVDPETYSDRMRRLFEDSHVEDEDWSEE